MWQPMLWICILFVPLAAVAQSYANLPLNERVLVVYNSWTKDSQKVADYYMAKRRIPKSNRCALKLDDRQAQDYAIVHWTDFDGMVKSPIKKCLQIAGKYKVLYIVMAYETPFKLYLNPEGYGMAIDSYISDIWDEAGGPARATNPYNVLLHGRTLPPHYLPFAAYRDKPGAKTVYSVWRLDGHSATEAEALIDKAIQAEHEGLRGQVCIDRRRGDDWSQIPEAGYGEGEWALQRAADASKAAGFKVLEDSHVEEFGTAPAPLRCDNAALYAGWYQLNNYNDAFTWNVGAIGIHMDSDSAVSPRSGKNWVANAITHGITVTAGAVEEPYLQGLPSPDVIFSALYDGANAGDAFFRGERWLRWMTLNIGDPLYRPFPFGRTPARK